MIFSTLDIQIESSCDRRNCFLHERKGGRKFRRAGTTSHGQRKRRGISATHHLGPPLAAWRHSPRLVLTPARQQHVPNCIEFATRSENLGATANTSSALLLPIYASMHPCIHAFMHPAWREHHPKKRTRRRGPKQNAQQSFHDLCRR